MLTAGQSRTKPGRHFRKKAVCFKGNRIDNSTACFASSGAGTLAVFATLAKRFLQCAKSTLTTENQHSFVAGDILPNFADAISRILEQASHFLALPKSDLYPDHAVILQTGLCL